MYKKILLTTSLLVLTGCEATDHEPIDMSKVKEIEMPNKFNNYPKFESHQEKMAKFHAELERLEKEKEETEKQARQKQLEELARKKAEADRIKAEEAERARKARVAKQPVQPKSQTQTQSQTVIEGNTATSKPTNDSTNVKTLAVIASAYTYSKYDPYVSEKWGDKTFTGKDVRFGYVAVDPNVIPLGTKMKIEGFGDTIFTAEDTGNAIVGNKVDIFLPTYEECINFGRRNIRVYILN